MALGPMGRIRDWIKFRALVREEIGFLIERHGARAREAALEELKAKNLPPRRMRVLSAAVRQLNR